ncbi:5'-methylthioadenosine/adenosylhomocysteine nucleosidase [Piscirickettsia litoralis]|uniref:adenosylhomocysteine nucleosidase n=1 Tax=Piscirickettsia litoralis TaxID=1891921 RepID=A0ABX3A3Z1_9GAMM|nr:5'-methylthioadenosine/adenosylhomocysteine nucleosidase [Piscirickettsia litoralis]ODN43576.1 nucleosidase [Piscirickettsia litoralis]
MTIAVLVAMEEEVQLLKEYTTGKTHEINNFLFHEANIHGESAIVVQTKIGKVNAAMATTLLIERFKPSLIINTGTAGGFHDGLNIGDIIIADKVLHNDVDVTGFGYAYGQIPGLPTHFEPDAQAKILAEQTCQQADLTHYIGTIATGDSFLSTPFLIDRAKTNINNLYAGEMEAAAVGQVCFHANVPALFIRAVSDIAGTDDQEKDFSANIQTASKKYTHFISEFFKQRSKIN